MDKFSVKSIKAEFNFRLYIILGEFIMPQNAWTLRYEDVVGLCRLAYRERNANKNDAFLIDGKTWRVEEVFVQGPFRAVLMSGTDLGEKPVKVLSFSGSDVEWGDWNLRGNLGNLLKGAENTHHYTVGLRIASKLNPDYLVGHSLGGGIALYCCVFLNIKAATINPSPIFFAPFGENAAKGKTNAPAVNYCVSWEMLAAGRNVASFGTAQAEIGITPGRKVTVASKSKDPYHRHLLANLQGFIEPQKQ